MPRGAPVAEGRAPMEETIKVKVEAIATARFSPMALLIIWAVHEDELEVTTTIDARSFQIVER
jgi:hypothetical protein